jgi:predicted SnoaL-like aldol condensation-catalyzing enzyme
MRALTKKQKIEAYTFAMFDVLDEKDIFPLVCYSLQDWLIKNNIDYAYGYDEVLDFFPEFLKQKPQGRSVRRAWWPAGQRTKRVKALEKAINLVRFYGVKKI